MPTADEEPALIERVKAGDREAFEALFRRYGTRVYRQACNLMGNAADAEEVVQEVFLAIHQKVKTFRGESAFLTWLYRLTTNAALTRLCRRQRSEEVSIEDFLPRFREDGHHLAQPVVDWSQEVEERLVGEPLRRILREALDLLPAVDKAVVVMSDLEGIPNREIGEAMGLSVPAVKARLHRARLFLRGKLAVQLGYSPA
ncbi:MAG: RNA polymerase sigma factor [Candidatus Methylomirabilales bacterium]